MVASVSEECTGWREGLWWILVSVHNIERGVPRDVGPWGSFDDWMERVPRSRWISIYATSSSVPDNVIMPSETSGHGVASTTKWNVLHKVDGYQSTLRHPLSQTT